MGRTKQQKAEYDKQRKAEGRKERRLTKPMKLFFKYKYSALYEEYMEFYNRMESENPNKKDLTKSQTFKEFLKPYVAETITTRVETITTLVETTSTVTTVVETSSVNIPATETSSVNIPATETSSVNIPATETSSVNIPATETSSVNIPATETSSVNIPATETSSVNIPATETSSVIIPAETSTSNNILFDVIETLFGPGGIDEYVDHMNNIDEGIDINGLDELKLDYEDFNFELECEEF